MVVRELVTLLGFQVEDSKLKSYEQGMQKVMRTIGLVSVGVAALGTIFVKTAGDMEQTQMAFEVMMGDAEKAKQMVDELYQMGAKTPYISKDLIEDAKMLMLYGRSADQTKSDLQMLGDIASGNTEKLHDLTYAYAQVQANGRLMGQDLLQMVNAGFNPLQIISQKTGKSMMELRKEMEQGGISAEMVTDAFKTATSEGGRFYRMMDKMSKTFLGRWSTVLDNLQLFAVEVGKEVLPMVGDLLDEFSKLMQANGGIIKTGLVAFFKNLVYAIGYAVVVAEEIIDSLGGLENIMRITGNVINFVWGLISGLVKILWKLRWILGIIITSMIIFNGYMKVKALIEYVRYLLWFTKATRIAAVAQTLLNGTMLANPIFWIILAIVALVAMVWWMVKNWDKVRAFFIKLWDSIVGAFKWAFNFIWSLLDNKWIQGLLAMFMPFIGIPIMIIKNWDVISGFFKSLWEGVVKIFMWAVDKIRGVWDWLVEAFNKIAQFLGLSPKDKKNGGKQGKPPKKGPKYAKGTDYVPEDQWAFVHKGERITPPGRGSGGTMVNNTFQIYSNPTIVVPEGTSKAQADYLKKTAKQVVHEEWQAILRQVKGANPIPGVS
jgi:tape measure domain-containing protein